MPQGYHAAQQPATGLASSDSFNPQRLDVVKVKHSSTPGELPRGMFRLPERAT